MYIPKPFQVDTQPQAWLARLLRRDPFATLVTTAQGDPIFSHLPVLLEPGSEQQPVLIGHWARGNPQWQGLDGQPATLLVRGPHAYVSPSWYPEPLHALPTWVYAVAHARGRIELVENDGSLRSLLEALTAHFESHEVQPWTLAGADAGLQGLSRGVIGFRLHVDQVDVALKLNQHHSKVKRRAVIEGLERSLDSHAPEVALLMEELLSAEDQP